MDGSRIRKEKVADSKISGYVVDVAQEYYSPTTYRAGAAVASTTRVIFSYTFRVIFYIRFQACFACLSSEGFKNPFFSVFVVAFQRPSVNETELNNDLRLSAVMIVCILG